MKNFIEQPNQGHPLISYHEKIAEQNPKTQSNPTYSLLEYCWKKLKGSIEQPKKGQSLFIVELIIKKSGEQELRTPYCS